MRRFALYAAVAGVLPLPAVAAAVVMIVQAKDLDELHQKVMLEAMGIIVGVPAVGIPYSLLIESGVAPSNDWFAYLIILMSLTFIASVIAGTWRYE